MGSDELKISELSQVIEAALLASSEPLNNKELKRLFEDEVSFKQIKAALDRLSEDWKEKSGELVEVASGWRIQLKPKYQDHLNRLEPKQTPRYSRAVLETLAIIVYKQPVTRGDIENIRGVAVSPNIIRTLESRGWVEQIGVRETPGRPALLGSTAKFLDDLGLVTISELPPLDDLGELIEANSDIAEQMSLDVDVDLGDTTSSSEVELGSNEASRNLGSKLLN